MGVLQTSHPKNG